MLKSFIRLNDILKKLLDSSFEFIFVVYLLSGIIKGIYLSKNWFDSFDITLISGLALSFLIARNIIIHKPKTFISPKLWRISSLLLFYLIAILTILYSPSEYYGYYKAIIFLTNILAIISPFFFFRFNIYKFISFVAFFAVLIGIYSLIVYGFYFSFSENILGHSLKFYRGFYLDSGYLLGLATILTLKLRNFNFKAILLCTLILLLWASAARGPIIFTTFSILIYISAITLDYGVMGILKKLYPKRLFLLIVVGSNILLITGIYQTSFGSTILNRTLYRFSVIVPPNIEETANMAEQMAAGNLSQQDLNFRNQPEQSNVDRIEHYVYSWNMINKSWKTRLLGYGFGSYGIIKDGTDGRLYPHNIFLEIWFETGLLGLLPFLHFIIYGMFWTLKNNQQIVGIAVLYLLANTFKSYSLIDHRIIMGIMGIAIFVTAKHPAFNWLVLPNTGGSKQNQM